LTLKPGTLVTLNELALSTERLAAIPDWAVATHMLLADAPSFHRDEVGFVLATATVLGETVARVMTSSGSGWILAYVLTAHR
jgi:hypothetical protein